MRLRPVEERDLENVRVLRNRNREWFFHDREISTEEQQRWFQALKDKPVGFFVIEHEGEVVGTISVTDTATGKEVGNLIIDERRRGQGLMAQAIAQVISEPGRYFCHVKPDNQASLRVFRRAGFADAYVCLERTVDR